MAYKCKVCGYEADEQQEHCDQSMEGIVNETTMEETTEETQSEGQSESEEEVNNEKEQS